VLTTIRKTVSLVTLIELPDNPHFMTEGEFQLLKENVKHDGGTGTRPIVGWVIHDDETKKPTHGIMILMGNHRKRACLEVGIETQEIIVIPDYLTPDERMHLALRDNNLHGSEDPVKLAAAYQQIGSSTLKSMTGLNDKKLGLFVGGQRSTLAKPGLLYNVIAITFLPEQLEDALACFELAKGRVKSRTTLVAAMSSYDAFMDALLVAKKRTGVNNIAAQLADILAVYKEHVKDADEA